jgi:hypothetical protein
VAALLNLVRNPYDEVQGMEEYAALPPMWARQRGVNILS